jgi:serpin B
MNRSYCATWLLGLLLLCACSGANRTTDAEGSTPDPVDGAKTEADASEPGSPSGARAPVEATDDDAPAAGADTGAPTPAADSGTPVTQDPKTPRTDEDVRRALAKPVSLDLNGSPLREALDAVEKEAGVPVEADWDALQYTGVGTSTTVSLRARKVSARSALEMLLCPLDLGWTVGNEGVLITTPEEIANALDTRVYDVADFNARDALIEIITRTVAFTSPASVAAALAMVYTGARAETADEMARTLRFPVPRESVPQGYAALLAAFAEAQGRGYELTVANRLWGQQEYAFRESYVTGLQESFGAPLDRVDFQDPAEAARRINEWLTGQTRGRIREIVSPSVFDELTRFVVTNAVYFKAPWTAPFPEGGTRPGPFHAPNGPVTVHMMHQSSAYRYTAVDKVEVLELPYAGLAASMVIVLPARDLASVEATLSAEKLDQWIGGLRTEMVDVAIPRFKLDSECELAGTLGEMGMARVFDPKRADLSGVAEGEGLWLNDVLHKALVEVDEKGTEAAAATAVGGMGMAGPPTAAPVFRADRPFLFLIRDLRTRAILFLGRLVEPEAIAQ